MFKRKDLVKKKGGSVLTIMMSLKRTAGIAARINGSIVRECNGTRSRSSGVIASSSASRHDRYYGYYNKDRNLVGQLQPQHRRFSNQNDDQNNNNMTTAPPHFQTSSDVNLSETNESTKKDPDFENTSQVAEVVPNRASHKDEIRKLMGESLQPPAGRLWDPRDYDDDIGDRQFIPQVSLHEADGRRKKRVLILCTGGTLTMAPDPEQENALAPVEGALSDYMKHMNELEAPHMPDFVLHEYSPFYDSSDLGPADWARIAHDIRANYLVRIEIQINIYTSHALSDISFKNILHFYDNGRSILMALLYSLERTRWHIVHRPCHSC